MAVGIQSNQSTILPDWTSLSLSPLQQLKQMGSHPQVGQTKQSNSTVMPEMGQDKSMRVNTSAVSQSLLETNKSGPCPTSHVREKASGVTRNPTREDPSTPWDPAGSSEWCAQMVCYLWFSKAYTLPTPNSNQPLSDPGQPNADLKRHGSHSIHHRSHRANGSSSTSALADQNGLSVPSRVQLQPTGRFLGFVKNVLRITQVSRSVVALSLYYIYRLKMRHPGLEGQMGSEYRLFLTSLVLANKFLDDHTYTNKTWSDVSHIPLKEITKMELQLWGGIDTNASASPAEYEWWQSTLERLYDQRHIDNKWLIWLETTPALSPNNSTPSDNSTTSASHRLSPAPSPINYPWVPSNLTSSPDNGKQQEPRMLKRRRPSDADDLFTNKKVASEPSQGLTVPDTFNATRSPHTPSPQAGATKGEVTLPVPQQANTSFTGQFVRDSGVQGKPWVPNIETTQHGAAGSNNLTVSEISNQLNATNAQAQLSGCFGMAPELFLPMKSYSPYSTPNMAGKSNAPMVFGYYRLAAGYSHGIPAFRCVNPSGNNSNAIAGMSGLPCASGASYCPGPNTNLNLPANGQLNVPSPNENEDWINSQATLMSRSAGSSSISSNSAPSMSLGSTPTSSVMFAPAGLTLPGSDARSYMYNNHESLGNTMGKIRARSPLGYPYLRNGNG